MRSQGYVKKLMTKRTLSPRSLEAISVFASTSSISPPQKYPNVRSNRLYPSGAHRPYSREVSLITERHELNRSSPGELQDGQTYLSVYLLDRLAQLGVKPMFGVPGDVGRSIRLNHFEGFG